MDLAKSLHAIADFLGRHIVLDPDQCRRYNSQCLKAVRSHRDRGTPFSTAGRIYRVSAEDVAGLDLLASKYREQFQENLNRLASGETTPAVLVSQIASGAEIEGLKRVRPYRKRTKATPLAC